MYINKRKANMAKPLYFMDYYDRSFRNDAMFLYFKNIIDAKNIKGLQQTTLEFTDFFIQNDGRVGEYHSWRNMIVLHNNYKYNASILLHEFFHAVLDVSFSFREISKKEYTFVKSMTLLNKDDHYGLTNYKEFFCEVLSNESFFYFVHDMYLCEEDNPQYLLFKHLNPEYANPNTLYYKLLSSSLQT